MIMLNITVISLTIRERFTQLYITKTAATAIAKLQSTNCLSH